MSGIDFASPYLEQMVPKNKEEELALKQFILQNAKDRIIRQAEHIIRSYQDVRNNNNITNVQTYSLNFSYLALSQNNSLFIFIGKFQIERHFEDCSECER